MELKEAVNSVHEWPLLSITRGTKKTIWKPEIVCRGARDHGVHDQQESGIEKISYPAAQQVADE